MFINFKENNLHARASSTHGHVPCTSLIYIELIWFLSGCDGGFPYLIGGKYAEDFGIVEEKCNPYKGKDGKCSTDKSCPRHYSYNYQYIGGFYGGWIFFYCDKNSLYVHVSVLKICMRPYHWNQGGYIVHVYTFIEIHIFHVYIIHVTRSSWLILFIQHLSNIDFYVCP